MAGNHRAPNRRQPSPQDSTGWPFVLVHGSPVVARPRLALRMLLRLPESLAFRTESRRHSQPARVGLGICSRPASTTHIRSKYLSCVVIEENDSQFGRLLSMRLNDLRAVPTYILPPKRFSFENEMIELARTSVFVPRLCQWTRLQRRSQGFQI